MTSYLSYPTPPHSSYYSSSPLFFLYLLLSFSIVFSKHLRAHRCASHHRIVFLGRSSPPRRYRIIVCHRCIVVSLRLYLLSLRYFIAVLRSFIADLLHSSHFIGHFVVHLFLHTLPLPSVGHSWDSCYPFAPFHCALLVVGIS